MDISSSAVGIKSYDAHAINDGTNYRASFARGNALMAETEPTYAERLDDYPLDTRTRLKERTFSLVVSTVAGSADELKKWLNAGKLTAKKLIVTDTADSPDSDWYVYAKFKSFRKIVNSTNAYEVVLSVANPIWTENSATAESWTVTASGQTHNITVGGTEYARPTIVITPRAVNSSGYVYKCFVTVYNPTLRPMNNYSINITGGNLNHAALVSGGKAQADGDDFRCSYDGITDRDLWTGGGGFNSTTFRPWVNINLKKRIKFTTLGAIASSGSVSVITFAPTSDIIAALRELKEQDNYLLLIDSELFTFTGFTFSGGIYSVTGVTRAAHGSSMASHSAGSSANWIEHNIWLYYGLSTATAPSLDSAYEPMIDRTNSTNTSLVFTNYYDPDYPNRPFTWQRDIIETINYSTSTPSGHYGANEATNTDLTAIASEMGISLKAWKLIVWRDEVGEIEWSIYLPSGVTNVTATGEKYRASADWPYAGLQASANGRTWTTIWTDASPASLTTWAALASHSAVSLGGTYQHLRFVMDGLIKGTADNLAHVEFDGVTLALNSSTVPVVSMGAEQSTYYINARISNDTSGDYIDVKIPGKLDVAVTIDCENKTFKDAGGQNLLASLSYGPDDVRLDWLTLDPTLGTNVISVTEIGLNDVDIDVTYNARSL